MKDPQFPELLNLLLEIRNLKVDKVKIFYKQLRLYHRNEVIIERK